MIIENENTFLRNLTLGINLFVGAGFSVLAYDKSGKQLPVGSALLEELKTIFNVKSSDLTRIYNP